MTVLQTAGTLRLRALPLHLLVTPACESYHSHGLVAPAAALGPHSSHVGSYTSGSIRLIAWRPLQRDPPAPSAVCENTAAVSSERTAGGCTLAPTACLFDCDGRVIGNCRSLLCW